MLLHVYVSSSTQPAENDGAIQTKFLLKLSFEFQELYWPDNTTDYLMKHCVVWSHLCWQTFVQRRIYINVLLNDWDKDKIWVVIVVQQFDRECNNDKPVEFKHCLQSHPAIIKLQLFFEELVPRKIVISKVVLEVKIRSIFMRWMWMSVKNIYITKNSIPELPLLVVPLSPQLETSLLDFLPWLCCVENGNLNKNLIQEQNIIPTCYSSIDETHIYVNLGSEATTNQ